MMPVAVGTKTDLKPVTQTRHMPLYKVLLHNDDVNDMLDVIHALRKVFSFSPEACIALMQEAHDTGVALCKIEPQEHAELHRDQLRAHALSATIEPE